MYVKERDAALSVLRTRGAAAGRLSDAATLLDQLVLGDTFAEFLTVAGASALDREP
jgi:hypothetical protein